jgi:hypothetical protein
MFIRKKMVRGKTYFALVENRWVRGKVRQRFVLSLGRDATIGAALKRERYLLDVFKKASSRTRGCMIAWGFGREDPKRPGCFGVLLVGHGEQARLRAVKSEAKIRLLERYRSLVTQNSSRIQNCGTRVRVRRARG